MRAPSWLREVPLAHRGLHDDACPENTLPAFEAAVAAGYGIELDVHPSRDGHAVVLHDLDLRRLAGRDGQVSTLDLADLRALRVLGTEHGIPTLDQVLAAVAGRVPVMVEIKNHGRDAGPLEVAVHEALRRYAGPACIASFNPRTVGWFARHAPHVVRVQTASDFSGEELMPVWLRPLLTSMAFNRRTRPHAISYELGGLPNRWVDAWRERGLPLVTWTVRSPQDLDRARRLADNWIFENVRP